MIFEDAPTNSIGTGAETCLPPAVEPGIKKSSKIKRRYAKSTTAISDMLKTEGVYSNKDIGYIPFLVSYDGAESYILHNKSEAALKIELRKMYRPENYSKIVVKRLYPNEVINFYWKKRQLALGSR